MAGRQWRAELCDAVGSQSSPLQIKNRQSGSDRRAASIFVKCDENRVSKEELPGHERLQLYLNDHLAGSVAAIELIDNLISDHPQGRARLGDADDSAELLEALEGLALGITGKKLLWRSLVTISANFPELQGTDFNALEERAQDQFSRVEDLRMDMTREAFRK